jgi:hypothetical protein
MFRKWPDNSTTGADGDFWAYDEAGRLKAIPGLITLVEYNARGQVTRVDTAGGVRTKRSYSPERGWLNDVATYSASAGSTPDLLAVTYTRDAAGRITDMVSANLGGNSGAPDPDQPAVRHDPARHAPLPPVGSRARPIAGTPATGATGPRLTPVRSLRTLRRRRPPPPISTPRPGSCPPMFGR